MTDDESLAIEWACARLVAPADVVHGRTRILNAFRARPLRKGRHICSNVAIDVLSMAEAQGECAIALFVEGADPKVGTFRDRFVKTANGWQFAERLGSLAY